MTPRRPGVPGLTAADVNQAIYLHHLGLTMEEVAEFLDFDVRQLYRVFSRRVQCGQCPAAFHYRTHLRAHQRAAHGRP